jgi:hypothetical protein
MNLHMCVRLGNNATSANSGFLGLPFVLLAAGDSEQVLLTVPTESPMVATCSGGDASAGGSDTTILVFGCPVSLGLGSSFLGLGSSFGVRGVGEASALSSSHTNVKCFATGLQDGGGGSCAYDGFPPLFSGAQTI